MGSLARRVPIAVLAAALAIEADPQTLVDDVTTAAVAYPTGVTDEQRARADDAVERLVELLGGRDDATVGRLTLLAQACDATAGLIGNSLNIALHLPDREDVDGILAETLRYCPPVRGYAARGRRSSGDWVMRRSGAAARCSSTSIPRTAIRTCSTRPTASTPPRAEPRHLTFGYGFRACPGNGSRAPPSHQASSPPCSHAAGAVRPESEIEYEPSPLRVAGKRSCATCGDRSRLLSGHA